MTIVYIAHGYDYDTAIAYCCHTLRTICKTISADRILNIIRCPYCGHEKEIQYIGTVPGSVRDMKRKRPINYSQLVYRLDKHKPVFKILFIDEIDKSFITWYDKQRNNS